MMQRLLCYAAIVLGLVGAIACLIAIVAAWSLTAQARRATETTFEGIDQALVVLQDRTERAADRVQASAITTRGMAEGLKQWTAQQARQEIATRWNLAENADRLRSVLLRADDWLELSESSARMAQQALSLANSLGAQMDPQAVDGLIAEVASLRIQLGEATQVVDDLHARATALAEGEIPAGRVEQAVRLALRVAATLGSIDARLERLRQQLSDLRQRAQELQQRTLSWIQLATIALTLLIAWMAAGQVALCCLAWKSLPSAGRSVPHSSSP